MFNTITIVKHSNIVHSFLFFLGTADLTLQYVDGQEQTNYMVNMTKS